MKKLTKEDIKIHLNIHYSDIPIRGNAIASGNSEFDKQVENELIDKLTSGDLLAWCNVEIIGEYKGLVSDPEYLGACSYASEKDFKEGGYYDYMVNTVLDDLNNKIADIVCDLVND